MNGFEMALNGIMDSSKKQNSDPEDYIGEDGLAYCSKCRTPKQLRIETQVGEKKIVITPYVPCKCRREELDREEQEQKERERQERLKRIRHRSHVPALYEDASFEKFQKNKHNQAIFKMVKNFADQFDQMMKLGKGLLLHGTVGTGKTYSAACIANALLDAGYTVFWTSTYEMLKLRSDDEEEKYEDLILGSSLLIVDDLGAERSTEFGRERVFSYVDSRCSTNKPTIYTTNLDFDKMVKPETQDESRIFDRILKRCFPIAFTGESWRRAEARDNFSEMKKILNGGA